MSKERLLSCTGNRHFKLCFNNGLEVFSPASEHVCTWTHTDIETHIERDFEIYLMITKISL